MISITRITIEAHLHDKLREISMDIIIKILILENNIYEFPFYASSDTKSLLEMQKEDCFCLCNLCLLGESATSISCQFFQDVFGIMYMNYANYRVIKLPYILLLAICKIFAHPMERKLVHNHVTTICGRCMCLLVHLCRFNGNWIS